MTCVTVLNFLKTNVLQWDLKYRIRWRESLTFSYKKDYKFPSDKENQPMHVFCLNLHVGKYRIPELESVYTVPCWQRKMQLTSFSLPHRTL